MAGIRWVWSNILAIFGVIVALAIGVAAFYQTFGGEVVGIDCDNGDNRCVLQFSILFIASLIAISLILVLLSAAIVDFVRWAAKSLWTYNRIPNPRNLRLSPVDGGTNEVRLRIENYEWNNPHVDIENIKVWATDGTNVTYTLLSATETIPRREPTSEINSIETRFIRLYPDKEAFSLDGLHQSGDPPKLYLLRNIPIFDGVMNFRFKGRDDKLKRFRLTVGPQETDVLIDGTDEE